MFVSHLCQHMTAGILSLVTESDANYTITANLALNAIITCTVLLQGRLKLQSFNLNQKDTFPKAPWPER